jgi:hypothetical protein
MDKICLINQPAGLGDIFFAQKISRYMIENDYEVIWPITDNFLWIKDYIKIPHQNFVSINSNFEHSEMFNYSIMDVSSNMDGTVVYIPLKDANIKFPNISLLEAKYALVEMDFRDWKNYFTYERCISKELALRDLLDINPDEDYALVNRNYGPPPNHVVRTQIPKCPNVHLKTIEMTMIPDFSLFDWCNIIENAKEIYTVDTAIQYIMDTLTLKAEKIYLWSRYTPSNFFHIKRLFDIKWIYMYHS